MAKKEAKANNKTNKTVKESKNKKSFFKGFKAELKKVIWPTPKQLVNSTVAVIVIVLVTAAIVFVLDIAFEALNKQGIDKIKEVITVENTTTENATTEGETAVDAEQATEETTENSEASTQEVQATDDTQNAENNAE